MSLLDFIKLYLKDDEFTCVKFFYYFEEGGKLVEDEEYSFEGRPSDFIENYTMFYDCLDGWDLTDVDRIEIKHIHCCGFTRTNIIMEYTYVG